MASDYLCPTCGREHAPGSNFCSACGAALAGAERLPQAPPPSGPRAYTPKHLIEKILGSRSAVEGERKQVTVFFADVKESMDLAERVDPEEWHRLMDRFFAILADGIHRFEGTINQFTGDGAMALFGAPIAHEDHAQRACHAALHLRDQLRLFGRELERTHGLTFAVRMGLNSGEVIVGRIGDDLRMDYTAQGHTVGLAARMQQIAEAGEIYLTADTAALVSRYFTLQPVGRLRVKGVREPVRTLALNGLGPARTRLEAARARGFSRLVGRADEAAVLEGVLSRAVAGNGQVIGIAGAPGVGKSRLCQAAVDRWRAEGMAVAEAHCPPHGRSLPGAALLDLLRSVFGITPADRPAAGRRRVRQHLRSLRRGLLDDVPLVLDCLGIADPKHPAPAIEAATRRAQLGSFVCRLVQTHSASAPLVLLIDDVHWIDPESDAFLAQLVDAVGWTRTLLLLNFRPGYSAEWMGAPYYQALPLAPLDAGAAADLLRELVGAGEAMAPLRAVIQARAEGNPFFIEEIVQSLIEQGVLVREGRPSSGAPVHLARPVEEIRIPATVQSVLAARIDGLPESAKQVLTIAAVIGKRFSEPVLRLALASAAPPGEAENPEVVTQALRTLQRADLIRSEGDGVAADLAFKHPLTQEVAYGAQLQEARARQHEIVARAIEVVHAARLGEHAALLAHHWDAAHKRSEAHLWRRRAALRVTNIQVVRARPPRT